MIKAGKSEIFPSKTAILPSTLTADSSAPAAAGAKATLFSQHWGRITQRIFRAFGRSGDHHHHRSTELFGPLVRMMEELIREDPELQAVLADNDDLRQTARKADTRLERRLGNMWRHKAKAFSEMAHEQGKTSLMELSPQERQAVLEDHRNMTLAAEKVADATSRLVTRSARHSGGLLGE